MKHTDYDTDLTGQEWEILSPLLPSGKPGGRTQSVDLCDVVNAIFYVVRSGCEWRLLPHDFPPWKTVYRYFHQWMQDGTWKKIHDTLYRKVRIKEGRRRSPVRDGITYARADIGITLTHDADGKKIPPETRTYAFVAVRRPQFLRPMLLLQNGRIHDWQEAVRAYADYLDRWDVEDCIRFGKQSLKTEQMQLRTFERLKRFLDLQLLLRDFLLREYDKGVRPMGADLREILLRSIQGDTRILSPYLLADHIVDSLRADQRQRDPDLVPCSSPQLALFPGMDTE